VKAPSRLLVITLAVLLSSCGGGGDSNSSAGRSPAVYARDFCTAFNTWKETVSSRSDQLQQDLSKATPENLEAIRDLLLTYLDDNIVLTDQAREDIRAAGVPHVENGAQIASALAGAIASARDIFDDARKQARNLPADDPDAFVGGLGDLATGLPKQFEAIPVAERLPDEASPELREAFTREPACEALN
jgi:AcrR family transcriptional regulator